jgi:hypothetical protein
MAVKFAAEAKAVVAVLWEETMKVTVPLILDPLDMV